MAAEERIQIHAWYSIPENKTSPDSYGELARCGFTTSYSGLSSKQAVDTALVCAQAAGVKLIISCPELPGVANDPATTTLPAPTFTDILRAWLCPRTPNRAIGSNPIPWEAWNFAVIN